MTKKRIREIIEGQENIKTFFETVGCSKLSEGIDFSCKKNFKSKEVTEKISKNGFNRYTPKSGDRIVEGYASTPDVDWVKDSVTVDALKDAEEHLLRTGTNTVFHNHDTDFAIGKVADEYMDEKGLKVRILISKAKDVNDIWTKIKEGVLSSFSIRFIAKRIEVIRDEDYNVESYNITKLEMLEVSIVGLPMNKEANVTNVYGKSIKGMKDVLNNKSQRSQKMTKKSRNETITEVVSEIVEEKLKEAIQKLNEENKLKKENEDLKKKLEDAEEKAKTPVKNKKKKTKKSKELSEEDKLKKENEDLKKKLEDAEAKRKGLENDDDDGEEKEVKKALKGIDDEDTCVFVLKAMKDSTTYDKLDEHEKSKVKNLYFKMLKEEKVI